MKTIDFYFDFASPFAYLANCALPSLADKYGCTVAYRPIDLFTAKLNTGNTGPSTPQMPLKFRYITKDLNRWADKYGVPFIPPWAAGTQAGAKISEVPRSWIDSSRANKGTFFATERAQGRDYVDTLWRATFGSGGMVGNDDLLRGVAEKMGWQPDEFLEFVQSDDAGRSYKSSQDEAHARGVFGVPIMAVGEEMWWGNDRLALLEEYLTA